jgi:hypothetical protein
MKITFLSTLIIAAALGIGGCSTGSQTKQGEPLLAKAAVVSTGATIVRVNYETREVTLEVPNKPGDNFVTVRVSDDVKNLEQVRFGDHVNVSYIEAVFIDLFQPGEVEPGIGLATATGAAKPGQRPAAAQVQKVSVVAVVTAIDKENAFVTLQVPEGVVKTVRVDNPAILDRLTVGSKVKTTVARGLAVAITPSPIK